MFSYVDLVRVEIALDAEAQFGVSISDEETDDWHTLGDIARMIVDRNSGKATEAEVFDWLRTLMAETYGVSMELTPDGNVFGDYDQVTGWFFNRKN